MKSIHMLNTMAAVKVRFPNEIVYFDQIRGKDMADCTKLSIYLLIHCIVVNVIGSVCKFDPNRSA